MKPLDRERRAHPRVSASRALLYQSDIYPKIRIAFTTDLSPEGARIEEASSLYAQEKLSLWVSLEQRVIPCRARVVHIRQVGDKFSAGIRFESMADEDRVILTQYLSNLTKDKRRP
jgi:c-di-GMP-binding flagellar brake protein YcgR